MAGYWKESLLHTFDLAKGSPASKPELRPCHGFDASSYAEPADLMDLVEQSLNQKVHRLNYNMFSG